MTPAERTTAILALKAAEPTLSMSAIAKRLDIALRHVSAVLNPEAAERAKQRKREAYRSPNPGTNHVRHARRA